MKTVIAKMQRTPLNYTDAFEKEFKNIRECIKYVYDNKQVCLLSLRDEDGYHAVVLDKKTKVIDTHYFFISMFGHKPEIFKVCYSAKPESLIVHKSAELLKAEKSFNEEITDVKLK